GLAFERERGGDDDRSPVLAGTEPHHVARRGFVENPLKRPAVAGRNENGFRRGRRRGGQDGRRDDRRFCARKSHDVRPPAARRTCGPSFPCAWHGRTTSSSTSRRRPCRR